MKNIEVEVRSFVDDVQFADIKNILDRSFEFTKELKEVTIYFSGEKDLRMRKNEDGAYVILKEGNIHDDFRKEFEIKINKEDFDDMIGLFRSLGFEIEIEWRRSRLEYRGGDMKILLDDTEGYGKILELERMAEDGKENEYYEALLGEMKKLGVEQITSKQEFNEKFEYYKKNWKDLIR